MMKPYPYERRISGKVTLSAGQVLRIAGARVYDLLGWPGSVGLACVLLAGAGWVWMHRTQSAPMVDVAMSSLAEVATAPVQKTEQVQLNAPLLPRSGDAVRIVRSLRKVAQSNGLNWPQADYKVTPVSDEGLATLDIRTSLKGPYPKVRQLLSTVLDKEPAVALRELTVSRPNGDAADVEAKIHWAVFLADGWLPANVEKPQ